MEALILSLLVWLGANTTLEAREAPPYKVVPMAEIIDVAIKAGLVEEGNRHMTYIAAACTQGILLIGSAVDIQTVWGQSIIVHELAHHWQTGCRGRRLSPAYQLLYEDEARVVQNAYIMQHGGTMFAPIITSSPWSRLRVPQAKACVTGGYC